MVDAFFIRATEKGRAMSDRSKDANEQQGKGSMMSLVERLKEQRAQRENEGQTPIIGPRRVVQEAPEQGVEAHRKIMELSEAHARYLEETGQRTVHAADKFKEDCLSVITEMCNPAIEAALHFKTISDNTARDVRRQAAEQAEMALSFTRRIAAMSKNLSDTLNGDHDKDKDTTSED